MLRPSSTSSAAVALACCAGLIALHLVDVRLLGVVGSATPPVYAALAVTIGLAIVRGWRWALLLPVAVLVSPGFAALLGFESRWPGGAPQVGLAVVWQALALGAGAVTAALFARRSNGRLVFRFLPQEILRVVLGAVVCGPLVASMLLALGSPLFGGALTWRGFAEAWSSMGTTCVLIVPTLLVWRRGAENPTLERERLSPLLGVGVAILTLSVLRANELTFAGPAWRLAALALLVGTAVWGSVRLCTACILALAGWLAASATFGWQPLAETSPAEFARALSDLGLIALGALMVLVVRVELVLRRGRLEGQRRLLETVVDNFPGSVTLRDASGQLLFDNRPHPTPATPVPGAEDPYRSPLIREAAAEVSEGDVSDAAQLGARWDEGEQLDSSGQILPVLHTELEIADLGDVAGAVGGEGGGTLRIALDVSGQRRAEEAVRASQAELLALLRSVPGTVLKISDRGRVLLSSDLADEVRRGRPFEEWFHPRDRKALATTLRRVASSAGGTGVVELRRAEPPYERVEVRLARVGGSPYGANRESGFTAVLQSVESQRAAERARQGLERELHRVARLDNLGFLAGGLAHDFNNLLTGILGNVQLAAELIGDREALDHLGDAELGAQRAAELCRQLLVYAGRGEITAGALDLSRVVRQILGPLQPRLAAGAELVEALDDDLPPIEGDAMQIQQVTMNLVVNASDALPEGKGRIVIATGSRIWSSEELERAQLSRNLPTREYVSLRVRDEGRGIAAEDLERIFQPFFTTKDKGTGLGLAAAQGLVHSLGGALRVESRLGEGTCFELLFPARRDLVLPSVSDVAREDVQDTSKGRVLVVDDEVLVRNLSKAALSKAGFDVALAEDGEQALALLVEHATAPAAGDDDPLVCVVIDLTMPRLTGDVLAQKILLRWPALPVVLISGHMPDHLSRSLRRLPFLAKPFRAAELVAAVRQAAAQRNGTKTAPDSPTPDSQRETS